MHALADFITGPFIAFPELTPEILWSYYRAIYRAARESQAAEIASLRERLAEAKEALAFYAFEGNWVCDVAECHGAPVTVPFSSAADGDHGDTARAALAAAKKKEQT